MNLVVTVDTEEDNWGDFQAPKYSVENIRKIPELQDLFNRFDVRPAYLLSYPVASNPKAVLTLNSILKEGRCEIGMQCHPWNTPPLIEEKNKKNSMLCNLSPELQSEKLHVLYETIVRNFNAPPVAFRAGRWGYGKDAAKILYKLGMKVDTSITPFTDWHDQEGPDFSKIPLSPYYFDPEDIFQGHSAGKMLEVPVSIGFKQMNHRRAGALFHILKKSPFHHLRLIGLLDRMGLLNKIWLSPEQCTAREMITLTRRLMQNKLPLIHFFFHSTTLLPGMAPYVRTEADRVEFIKRIADFLTFTRAEGIQPIKLSECGQVVS